VSFWFIFYREDGGDIFVRNVSYIAEDINLHKRRYDDLKAYRPKPY
jgi:hypothetical protein